eukprot:363745-Chlamydomonas_euryale.AAC.3
MEGCTTSATPATASARPCHASNLLGLLKFAQTHTHTHTLTHSPSHVPLPIAHERAPSGRCESRRGPAPLPPLWQKPPPTTLCKGRPAATRTSLASLLEAAAALGAPAWPPRLASPAPSAEETSQASRICE